ncbi:MAG: isoprenylcysteine carboxylmethyltransferase family protein [Bacteroidetes bacterium]|nr:isoprenylcysteine carboxylmethyltransferase family protein [Bacteroidota bacterium]MCL2302862.1 isoprenylcysteine carboxylmethyltransferase family protein [Lentimicrobiaceae bacterium]
MALQETFEEQGNWLFKRRSYFPIIILTVGILWYIFLLHNHEVSVHKWWVNLLFLCVGFLGLGIRIFTIGFTPAGTSGRNTDKGQVAEQLNTSGIYAMVRHPLYLGNFFMWLAPVLIISDMWFILFFCAFYWIYYERIMFAEEQFLRKKFGQTYLDWANKTPAFFPKFSQYKKANLNFSLKNVLKREYSGFFGMIFIMTMLRMIGFAVTTEQFYLDKPWIIIFSVAFVIFALLKMLKKFTKVLNVEGR